ncbi:hypothetical protein C8R46DRAFT_589340 [Mycena filopes]|nr:hypothetical protein C8R46DRAFT_589340 [Mycena filopes]
MHVARVDPAKDMLTEEWTKAPSPSLVERRLYFGRNPVYDPAKMKGIPVRVQIVGGRKGPGDNAGGRYGARRWIWLTDLSLNNGRREYA